MSKKITRVIYPERIPSGTSQQRKLAIINGKATSYPSKTLTETRRIYASALKLAEMPLEPLGNACRISVSFMYETKDKRKLRGVYKSTKPDLDNLLKPFLDSLVKFNYLQDDSIIVQISANKKWSEKTMILFEIEEV